MNRNFFLFKKSNRIYLLLLVAFTVVFSLYSCKGKDQGKQDTTFKMNCVTLTKADIQKWVDKGWTKPDNPDRIKVLLFQFFSQDPSKMYNNMQLIAYPGSSGTNVIMEGKTTLKIDSTCVAKAFTSETIIANNSFNFDSLKITNPDGSLNDFDFIRLRPANDYPPYINFQVEIVRVGVTETVSSRGTDPCPPYCPKPPPPLEAPEK